MLITSCPPGSATSFSGTMKPRTRVTAYIVSADRKGADSRDVKRVAPGLPTTGALKLPPSGRQPQPAASGELQVIGGVIPAKERFIRNKPHVNVGTPEAARKIRAAKP